MSIITDDLVSLCQTYVNSISNRVEPSDWYTFITSSIREVRRGRTFPDQRMSVVKEFFTHVFRYDLPTDYESFIKPHANMFEEFNQGPYMVYGRDKDFFANSKYGLAINSDKRKKYLLARINGVRDMIIDSCDGATDGYTAGGDINSLILDQANYYEGGGSLGFSITNSSGQGNITKTIDQTDITDFVNMGGSIFFYLFCPTAIISATISLYTNAGNYYSLSTNAVDYLGNSFSANEWNLLKFDFKNSTVVGTPDKTNITYYTITINHAGVTESGYNLDSVFLGVPSKMILPYNSKFIVNDGAVPTPTYKESVTAGTDVIMIDECYIELLAYKSVEHAAKWKFGDEDVEKMAKDEFDKAYVEFSRRNPSVEAPLQSNYYRRNRDGQSHAIGRLKLRA